VKKINKKWKHKVKNSCARPSSVPRPVDVAAAQFWLNQLNGKNIQASLLTKVIRYWIDPNHKLL